jgi:hypothetical protein
MISHDLKLREILFKLHVAAVRFISCKSTSFLFFSSILLFLHKKKNEFVCYTGS